MRSTSPASPPRPAGHFRISRRSAGSLAIQLPSDGVPGLRPQERHADQRAASALLLAIDRSPDRAPDLPRDDRPAGSRPSHPPAFGHGALALSPPITARRARLPRVVPNG